MITRLVISRKLRLGPLMRLVISTRLRWSMRRVAAAMPMNTPQAKKPVVTSCSQSHGAPSSRVTTSQNTESVNPKMDTPQSTMSSCSSGSSAFHFRWRWRSTTSESFKASSRSGKPRATALLAPSPVVDLAGQLLYVANQLENLHRVGSELLGKLILDRGRGLDETRLVDALDDLHTHRLQLLRRVRL